VRPPAAPKDTDRYGLITQRSQVQILSPRRDPPAKSLGPRIPGPFAFPPYSPVLASTAPTALLPPHRPPARRAHRCSLWWPAGMPELLAHHVQPSARLQGQSCVGMPRPVERDWRDARPSGESFPSPCQRVGVDHCSIRLRHHPCRLAHLPGGREARVEELTIGYRVQRQSLELANRLLPSIAPDLRAPEAIREGEEPWFEAVPADTVARAIVREMEQSTSRRETLGVISPPRMLDDLLVRARANNLEVDAVDWGP
jgi:hypothetical protein